MKMRRLMAIKAHKYGTRQLTAGDEYEAPDREAFALVAARRARFANKSLPRVSKPLAQPTPVPAPTSASPEPQSVGAMTSEMHRLEALRTEALRLGVAVDGRWGIARLRQEITQAKR